MTLESLSPEMNERHAEHLGQLRDELMSAVAAAIRGQSTFVLLDVPEHTNVGDHAIHLGQLAIIKSLGGRIVYRSTLRTNVWALIDRQPEAAILLHGGGNLGDLWPKHQAFREEVLRRFPQRDIVIMPQTVSFGTKESLERAKESFGRHSSLTLLLRDGQSLAYCLEHFDVRTQLCPDAALSLRLQPRRPPTKTVIALMRTDKESRVSAPQVLAGIPTYDWIEQGSLQLLTAAGIAKRMQSRLRRRTASLLVHSLIESTFNPISRYHVARGARIVSGGAVVITDRLHGHVLCMILGIPHIVLDNSYGKVLSFVNTWSSKSPIVRVAASIEEASDEALRWSHELTAARSLT